MNERYLAPHQAKANNVWRPVERLQLVEDGMALWMTTNFL